MRLLAEQQMVIGLHDISQLKAVEQMKSNFVAMVSHELRAPLTTATGSVETLSLLNPATDTESYHEVLSILDQQTLRLCQVVEEDGRTITLMAERSSIAAYPAGTPSRSIVMSRTGDGSSVPAITSCNNAGR